MDSTVRTHIDNMMARFRCARPKDSNPVLLPSKAVTSPRETAEVQPYIVVCPADLVTLFNALYPQNTQRPTTGTSELDVMNKKYGRSIGSGTRPLLSRPPSIFENASVFSSSSSVASD